MSPGLAYYFPSERDEGSDFVFAILGRAMGLVALFETAIIGLASTIQALEQASGIGLNILQEPEKFSRLVAELQRRPLYRAEQALVDRGTLPIQDILDNARQARNELVHEVPYLLISAHMDKRSPHPNPTIQRIGVLAAQIALGLAWIEHIADPPNERMRTDAIPGYVQEIVQWVCQL